MPKILATMDRVTETWADPSEEKLFDLISELNLSHQFLIAERVGRPEHFMQIRISDDFGHYDIEYREGGEDRHFCAKVSRESEFMAHDLVAGVFANWAFERDGWREALPWEPLKVRCGCCGTPITDTDRMDIRLFLPDVARDLPETGNHKITGGLLRVDGEGSFARCLLPITLTGGLELVFGTWMKISDADLRHAAAIWDTPEYADLVLTGTFAHAIKPWEDALGAPLKAVVRDIDEIPYAEASDDELLQEILNDVWDRDDVLSYFAHAMPVSFNEWLSDEWSIERTAGLAAQVVDGTSQFTGPGRTVYIDQFNDRINRSPEEFLRVMLDGAPEVPADQTVTKQTGDLLRHAFWMKTTVDGHEQHELHGYVICQGSALSFVCIHDSPEDHAWAMHVSNSAAHRATA